MNFSIRAIIRGLVAPRHCISCSSQLWREGLAELHRRGAGHRESGAFLLGYVDGHRRKIERFAYYDDLDSRCLESGIVVFDGAGYGPLWQLCRELGLNVVADVHTHGGRACQSEADRTNPMVAISGHIAIIVPDFAQRMAPVTDLGIYEYQGEHRWQDHSGRQARQFLYIGMWG